MRGRGSDLYRIREYMPEDSARHVDWKATAKSGSLKVREFSREDERKLCIVFDNPAAGLISGPAYEQAVNLAASLAWHFSSQDAEVSFVVPGLRPPYRPARIPRATGSDRAPERSSISNSSATRFTARSAASRCAPTNRPRHHQRIQHHSHRARARELAHGVVELLLLCFSRQRGQARTCARYTKGVGKTNSNHLLSPPNQACFPIMTLAARFPYPPTF